MEPMPPLVQLEPVLPAALPPVPPLVQLMPAAPPEGGDDHTGLTGISARGVLNTSDPFSLATGSAPPLGSFSKEEMARLLHVMCRAARSDDPDSDMDAFVQSAQIERVLRSTGGDGLTLYEWLLQMGDTCIQMSDVHERFGFDHRITPGAPLHDDPTYRRPIDKEIMLSLRCFLGELDSTLTSLPGLADGEATTSAAIGEAAAAKGHALAALGDVLCNPDATQQMLLSTATQLRARLCRRAVLLRIERVKTQMHGVNCLARLCSCATQLDELRAFIQAHFVTLADVCADPPDALRHQLQKNGLSLAVLASCIARFTDHCIGASNMPPSLGRTLDMVDCYFACRQRRRAVAESCVAALDVLRGDMEAGPEACRWHAVCLCEHAEAMRAITELGIHSAFKLRGPSHTSVDSGFCVRVIDGFSCALRVARFAHLLVECARKGVLVVGRLRASLLLPSVARWATDMRFRAAELGYYTEMQNGAVHCRSRVRSALPPAPLLVPVPEEEYNAKVCAALVRDYHIVLATKRVVGHHARCVKVSMIKEILTADGGFMQGRPPAEVSANVCRVVQKCIARAKATDAHNDCDIEYLKPRRGQSGGSSIRCDGKGAALLDSSLQSLAADMRMGHVDFVNDWIKTRASRQRARAAAARLM